MGLGLIFDIALVQLGRPFRNRGHRSPGECKKIVPKTWVNFSEAGSSFSHFPHTIKRFDRRICTHIVRMIISPLRSIAVHRLPARRSSRTATPVVTVAASKKGKKGKQGKQGKAPSAIPKSSPKPYLSASVVMQNLLLIESYFRKTGRPLFDQEVEIQNVAQLLWEAPFALMSHDASEDPKVTYANKAGLALFEAEWDEMIGVESKNTAREEGDVNHREERAAMLKEALAKGYVDSYTGVRQTIKGDKEFKILDATIFSIESPGGDAMGQGAVVRLWEKDGAQGGPLAVVEEALAGEGQDPAVLEALQAEVDRCAAIVRDLKENQGLSNSDEAVQAAVADLLAAKSKLA